MVVSSHAAACAARGVQAALPAATSVARLHAYKVLRCLMHVCMCALLCASRRCRTWWCGHQRAHTCSQATTSAWTTGRRGCQGGGVHACRAPQWCCEPHSTLHSQVSCMPSGASGIACPLSAKGCHLLPCIRARAPLCRWRQVVFAVRGTKHIIDLLVDLSSEHPYMAGTTHWGMHTAALWLVRKEGPRVAGRGWRRVHAQCP
jgi:hypothetical protein